MRAECHKNWPGGTWPGKKERKKDHTQPMFIVTLVILANLLTLTKSSMTSLTAVANKTSANGTAVVYLDVGETPSIC